MADALYTCTAGQLLALGASWKNLYEWRKKGWLDYNGPYGSGHSHYQRDVPHYASWSVPFVKFIIYVRSNLPPKSYNQVFINQLNAIVEDLKQVPDHRYFVFRGEWLIGGFLCRDQAVNWLLRCNPGTMMTLEDG